MLIILPVLCFYLLLKRNTQIRGEKLWRLTLDCCFIFHLILQIKDFYLIDKILSEQIGNNLMSIELLFFMVADSLFIFRNKTSYKEKI